MPSRILTRIGTSTDRPTLTVGEFGLDIDSPYNLWIGAPNGNKLLGTSYAFTGMSTNALLSVKDFGATGNGTTDDYASIMAAINFGGASKRAIYFPSGTYLIGTGLVAGVGTTTYSDLTIFGNGYDSVIKLKNYSARQSDNLCVLRVNSPNLITGSSSRVSIHDLLLDANAGNHSATSFINGADIGALSIFQIKHANVRNVYTRDCIDTGIYLRSCWYSEVDSCTVDGVKLFGAGNGINVVGLNELPFGSNTGGLISVTNCNVVGSNFLETDNADAIYVAGFGNAKIVASGNKIENFALGVTVEMYGVNHSDVIMSNNIINNPRISGIGMSQSGWNDPSGSLCRYITISNNLIIGGTNGTGVYGIGIPDQQSIITGNQIRGCAFGMYYQDNYNYRTGTGGHIISNNLIEIPKGGGQGIIIQKYGSGTAELKNVIISNNIITGQYGTGDQYGMLLYGKLADFNISNNIMYGISDYAIWIAEQFCGTAPKGFLISGNIIKDIGIGTWDKRGVMLLATGTQSTATFSRMHISNNYIGDTRATTLMSAALLLSHMGTSNGNWVHNNDLNSVTGYRIFLDGGTAIFRDNLRDYSTGPDNTWG